MFTIINLKDIINLFNENNNLINNLFKLLSQLTYSPILDYNILTNIINNLNDNHNIYIYTDNNNNIIGIITLIIEQKLIHGGKCVGHIEDLVVDNKYLNNGIAKQLINHCIEIARSKNCYKIILDCKEELLTFYNKVNFKQQGICMRFDI